MSDHRPLSPPSGTEVITDDRDDGWSASRKALPIELPTGEARYQVERELARGSMGIVRVARDLSLQRLVALKSLHPEGKIPNAAARFLDEARITAQLQHPGIVAVYEISVDADECPFFSMQLVHGRTLHAILSGLRQGDPTTVRSFGRIRLLNIFMQACMAVAYAHGRGVIHRDLKPENIMLGEYGETFVMDWGLAKIIDSNVPMPVVGGRPDEAIYRTRVGDITGTPMYMSPEQAMGLVDALSERTDIYALGALLYELLTFRPPVSGTDTHQILQAVRAGQIEPPSSINPDVTPAMDAIVMRALARDPGDRYESARDLRDEVEACMLGGHTNLGRVRQQARTLRDAQRAGQTFREMARRRRRFARDLYERQALRLPDDDLSNLETLWSDQTRLARIDKRLWQAFDTAVALFHQTLSERPEHDGPHEGLRDLLWYRFLEAERAGDRDVMALYRSLAAQHDPRGTLRGALQGDGSLSIKSNVVATASLEQAADDGRRLGWEPAWTCGTTPIQLDPLSMGTYRVELRAKGYAPARIPVRIARQEPVELSVHLIPAHRMPAGYALIPAGPYWRGSNADAIDAPPRARATEADFLIAHTPVTVGDWALFLNTMLTKADAQQIHPHIQHTGVWRIVDGEWITTRDPRMPIAGVDDHDIQAYLTWRRQLDGLPWRLPTAGEWEKAARGVDGRSFPWGDRWEPTFCRCADSPGGGSPGLVDNPSDQSPYGVRDLAGGVREWTSSVHPQEIRFHVIKGGGFMSYQAHCHLAAQRYREQGHGASDIGFRLALDASAVW